MGGVMGGVLGGVLGGAPGQCPRQGRPGRGGRAKAAKSPPRAIKGAAAWARGGGKQRQGRAGTTNARIF